MDLAIIPGGNTLFGQKIAERLIGLGMGVIALGEDFSGVSFKHPQYRCIEINPFASESAQSIIDALLEENANVYALVFAGKVTARHPLEEVHGDDLQPFLQANLQYPLQWIHRVLPLLIRNRGYLIRLGWNGRGEAPGYSLDALVEGAWHHFFRKLFEDVRDTGVKVATVYPEPNVASSDRMATSQSQSHLNPELVGEAVEGIFRMRESNLVAEIVVRPQATREEPRIPQTFDRIAVSQRIPRLPEPENRLVASPVIVTPEPKRPDDAPPPGTEEEGEDDIELDAEEMKLLNRDIESIERATDRKQGHGQRQGHDQGQGQGRRRRRRRGGRRQHGSAPAAEERTAAQPQGKHVSQDPPPSLSRQPVTPQPQSQPPDQRRVVEPVESAPPRKQAASPAPQAVKKVARKTTAKKAVKKAVTKTVKKATTKVAAKKATTRSATKTARKTAAKKAVKKAAVKEE